ncbi:MAG: hypothetical protein J6X28_05150 [Bacilli bacterium]|nr:hypothetical protein [Bacilli bacterium]
MSSRLRTVEHIVVFDMDGEMVAEPFWYKYQKETYFGDKKLREVTYNSRPMKMKKSPLETLKKRVNRMLNKPFCWTDVEGQPEWLDVNIRGGSTISYMGNDKNKFLQKVMNVQKRDS